MSAAATRANDPNLPLYGTLIGRKLAVPSTRTSYVAVDQALFMDLMASRLADVPVDEAWYLATYPDVKEAIESGAMTSASHHYARFGYFEHRMPRRIVVDAAWYLETYPDVKAAIGPGRFASAQDHFEFAGFREGRLPYAGFDLFKDDTAA